MYVGAKVGAILVGAMDGKAVGKADGAEVGCVVAKHFLLLCGLEI